MTALHTFCRCLRFGALWLALACGPVAPALADACPSVPWLAVSTSVWAWLPDQQDPQAPPQPITVVIDGDEALLIDPGSEAAQGARVQRSLACRFGAHLRWVVLTHGDPDSVRGVQGLTLPDAASVKAHPALVRRLADGCEVCGVDAGRLRAGGSEVQAGQVLSVGRLQVQVLATYQAHSPGDLLLWLAPEGVLWAGGLLDRLPLPEASRAAPQAWLQALAQIEQQPLQHLLAHGHWAGRSAAQAAVKATREALVQLQTLVQQAWEAGRLPEELDPEAGWPSGVPRTPVLRSRHRANLQRMVQVVEAAEVRAGEGSVPQRVGR